MVKMNINRNILYEIFSKRTWKPILEERKFSRHMAEKLLRSLILLQIYSVQCYNSYSVCNHFIDNHTIYILNIVQRCQFSSRSDLALHESFSKLFSRFVHFFQICF